MISGGCCYSPNHRRGIPTASPETIPSLRVVISIAIPGQRVVEGVSPIWADLNGDGQREIIVTQSDAEQGRRWSSIPSLENNWQRAWPWARQSLAASVCCSAFWQ
jgi:hypothetical protein